MRCSLSVIFLLLGVLPADVFATDCGYLKTQSEMNQCTYEEFQRVDAELNSLYGAYRSRLDVHLKRQLKAVQLAWVKFRDLACEYESTGVKGGSVYPFILQSCLTSMTRSRVEQLHYLANCEEGDLSCPAHNQTQPGDRSPP